jgi:hypothetical protein
MAMATVKLKPPVVQPIESVTLTLDEDEVKTLIAILNRIGGSPNYSARKYSDKIRSALHDELNRIGVEVNTAGIKIDVERSGRGSIYFAE